LLLQVRGNALLQVTASITAYNTQLYKTLSAQRNVHVSKFELCSTWQQQRRLPLLLLSGWARNWPAAAASPMRHTAAGHCSCTSVNKKGRPSSFSDQLGMYVRPEEIMNKNWFHILPISRLCDTNSYLRPLQGCIHCQCEATL
jgi:hypothetical protein